MRHILQRALERAGHDVLSFARGDQALPVLAEDRFNLLLADIVMPEMDSIQFAQAVVVADPRIKIMFITGFAAMALHRRKSARVDAKVLSNPFHMRELVEEIDKLMAA